MGRSFRRWSCAVIALGMLTPLVSAQTLPTTVINSTFSSPLYGTSAPGAPGTLYVVQQGGAIRPLNVQTGTTGFGTIGPTLLNLPSVSGSSFISGGEQGLLGLAFHPNFQSNGLMYAEYTYNNGQPGGGIRVEQYHVTNGVADAASRLTVLQWDHDPVNGNTNHNGGWIGFNPAATGAAANNLYITTGDGGGANNPSNSAQDTTAFQGKILRVNVGTGITAAGGYTIPTGNRPATGGDRPEIYSLGLRNPFRASFDRGTGNLYVGDVGQGAREEIDFIPNGATGGQNFGWRVREGSIQNPAYPNDTPPANAIDPIHDYTHAVGQAVTGGYVYHGTAKDTDGVTPLDGTYFFGDYVAGKLFSFRYNGTAVTGLKDRTADFGFTAGQFHYSSFAEDGFGNLYAIDLGGNVIRLVPVPEPASIGLCAGVGLVTAAGWRRWRRA